MATFRVPWPLVHLEMVPFLVSAPHSAALARSELDELGEFNLEELRPTWEPHGMGLGRASSTMVFKFDVIVVSE